MKKKILLGAVASLFAVATVFNMGLLTFNKQSDATLEAIAVMTEASGEHNNTGTIGPSGSNWKRTEFNCEKTVTVGFDYFLQKKITKTTYYRGIGCGYGKGTCISSAGC